MMANKSKTNSAENQLVKALGGAYGSHIDVDKQWEADKNEKFSNCGFRFIIRKKSEKSHCTGDNNIQSIPKVISRNPHAQQICLNSEKDSWRSFSPFFSGANYIVNPPIKPLIPNS